ncbi:MAG: hypothetical protein AAB439_02085 [Patescibacteria group bacterium]
MKNKLVSSIQYPVSRETQKRDVLHTQYSILNTQHSPRGFTSTSENDANGYIRDVRAPSRQTLKGFTLLIAVLISGILLALGFAIYNIASKDIILSSSGRESQFAFYAADSGTECALYWDYQFSAFATTSALAEINCGDEVVPLTRTYDAVTGDYRTTFSFSLGSAPVDACSSVEVTKVESPVQTVVVASGYNTCVAENPRRIERAIRVQY